MSAERGEGGAAGELVVRIDRIRCMGTGLCAATAPADLELGPDGRAAARHTTTAPSTELTEAAEICPTEAISVHLAVTGERVAPL